MHCMYCCQALLLGSKNCRTWGNFELSGGLAGSLGWIMGATTGRMKRTGVRRASLYTFLFNQMLLKKKCESSNISLGTCTLNRA